MNNSEMSYFKSEDILHLLFAEGPEEMSREIAPDVTAELDADGALIGIEILNASRFVRDAILNMEDAKAFMARESEEPYE